MGLRVVARGRARRRTTSPRAAPRPRGVWAGEAAEHEPASSRARLAARAARPPPDDPVEQLAWRRLTARHGDRLGEIMDEYGWPTAELVGEEARTRGMAHCPGGLLHRRPGPRPRRQPRRHTHRRRRPPARPHRHRGERPRPGAAGHPRHARQDRRLPPHHRTGAHRARRARPGNDRTARPGLHPARQRRPCRTHLQLLTPCQPLDGAQLGDAGRLTGFVHFKRQRLSIGSGAGWLSTVT